MVYFFSLQMEGSVTDIYALTDHFVLRSFNLSLYPHRYIYIKMKFKFKVNLSLIRFKKSLMNL